jgi:hypothetical protein
MEIGRTGKVRGGSAPDMREGRIDPRPGMPGEIMKLRCWRSLVLIAAGGLMAWFWVRCLMPRTDTGEVFADPPPGCWLQTRGGNYVDAFFRYRTNQPTHWRYIMLQH